ncbi:MAG TPA: ribosomal protein S18-alanine N-acetyltransferase [Rhodocyclaceae bacterium]|jgi:ribosomal-protein-alanine N-acetyltransferase|nr:ribosomal protein S18-alanine N-acetyltransferase [Rhodocyclaceae bacterium]
MTTNDLDAVLAIEIQAHHSPWTRGNFTDSLDAGHVAVVMREHDDLLGYAVLMPLPQEIELLNITIAPQRQGRGWGRRLLQQIGIDAKMQGAKRMFLEVRESNYSARALYVGGGFGEIGVRRNYYATVGNQREDAILMAKTL